MKKILILLLAIGLTLPGIHAQNENERYFIISGVVKNKANKKKMESVSVTITGTGIGTVTNEDGEFSLKISETTQATSIEFSFVGFYNNRVSIDKNALNHETYFMTPKPKNLKEITVVGWTDPAKLVLEAIKKIEVNYSPIPNLLTGFYRETAQKRKNYINIAEAVIQIYKTKYTDDIYHDRVQIQKGRKLLSAKAGDTLAVKLLGGPNLSLTIDLVKNRELLFNIDNLDYYRFTMEEMTLIDDRLHFVVSFDPQVVLPYALFYGRFFIDAHSLSFTRAEFSLDMKDKNKATDLILRRKPAGLRFNPEEVAFVISYKQRDSITYLNYVRNEIRFKCDWKKRLFATNYTIVSEMVVTNNQTHDAVPIQRKEGFDIHNSLSDKVGNFYDDDFWGAYNIIEPSESLESAVNKLKKGYR
ncbi:MAG: carboxypeptidase-like regulatory domain-containing protein [Dysgonamonadaceae bacterium]|nr:carboxypeptidase-like regulatory domain-containing protein [Dysgonamonadaceae bacterium]